MFSQILELFVHIDVPRFEVLMIQTQELEEVLQMADHDFRKHRHHHQQDQRRMVMEELVGPEVKGHKREMTTRGVE